MVPHLVAALRFRPAAARLAAAARFGQAAARLTAAVPLAAARLAASARLAGVAAAMLLIPALPAPAHAQERTPEAFMAAIQGPQPSPGPNDLGALTLEELLERFGVPGVSIAVIHDHAIHWAQGYGVADEETGAPVDTATLFQAASISKPVAAMAVLRAVQDGVFGLDDDINGILTSWTLDRGEFAGDGPVTPRMLTSHTSGLGDGFGFPGYNPAAPLPTALQILEGHEHSNVGVVFMERPPMSLMEYSGGGVTVMQQALSDALGRPFADILQDHVLGPIGMEHSTFQQPLSPELDRNAARAHSREGEAMGPRWHVYPELAAAGLWTTPSDLARFAIEVQRSARGESNRVLFRTTVQEMLSPVGVGDYAVGFSIAKRGQGWYFSHGGSNWGFQAMLMAHRAKGYGLAIMTNGAQGGPLIGELSRRIQMAYGWDSMAEPAPRGYRPPVARTEIQLPEETLGDYVGVYELAPGATLTITLEGGRLHGQPSGQEPLPLYPEAPDRFFLRAVDAQMAFTRDPGGAVTGLVLTQGTLQQNARKTR